MKFVKIHKRNVYLKLRISKLKFQSKIKNFKEEKNAPTGSRTRVDCLEGNNHTVRPLMLADSSLNMNHMNRFSTYPFTLRTHIGHNPF